MNIDNKQRTQLAVALGAIVVLVAGYAAFGKSEATSSSAAQGRPMGGPPGKMQQDGYGRGSGRGGPDDGQMQQGDHGGQGGGQMQGGGPGDGQMPRQVTGSAAAKAKSAALKEVDGTVRGVMEGRDGDGYVVFVETDDGPVVVELSKSFKVTEKHEMNRGGGRGGPPAGQQGGPPQPQGDDVQ